MLGIDHLCASCLEVEEARGTFERLGFSPLFEERELKTPKEKLPFMRTVSETNDFVFLKSGSGPSLEMIRHHDSLSNNLANYKVVLSSSPSIELSVDEPVPEALEAPLVKVLGSSPWNCSIDRLPLSFFQPRSNMDGDPKVPMVVMETQHLVSSSEFWEKGLGFSTNSESLNGGALWRLMAFKAVRPGWSLKLLLVESRNGENRKSYIDDPGWTCISMLVRDIDSTLAHLRSFDLPEYGDPFSMDINKKSFRLCFLRGPSNELVELMELVHS